jgi:hypothetical protein
VSLTPSSIAHGAGPAVGAPKPPHVTSIPAVGAPKPVQCMSVPDTPLKGTTPATGSPAPELRIEQEPVGQGQLHTSQNDKNAILGPQDPSVPKRPAPEPEVDIAGPDSPEQQQKAPSNEPPQTAEAESGGSDPPPEKKAKLADKAADVVNNVKAKVTGKPNGSRASKDKPRAAPGKTERKTRSQGPAEAL